MEAVIFSLGQYQVRVNPLTYLSQLRYLSLFDLGQSVKADIARACQVKEDLVIGLIHDFCLVSMRVETDHPIAKYLATPTLNEDVFRQDMIDFIDGMADDTIAIGFDAIVKMVKDADKPRAKDYQLPHADEDSLDPND
jgi:hypothetical protein